MSFFRKYSAGDLAARINSMTMLTQELASILLGGGLTAALSLVYVAQIACYTPALAIPALVIALLQAALTVGAAFALQGYERESAASSAKLSGTVTALLNGLQKIKLAGAEDRAFSRWSHEYAAYVRATYNRPIVLRSLPAIVSLIGVAGNILIYYLAGRTNVNVAESGVFFPKSHYKLPIPLQLTRPLRACGPLFWQAQRAPRKPCAPSPSREKSGLRSLRSIVFPSSRGRVMFP